jgi:hypothetical protein
MPEEPFAGAPAATTAAEACPVAVVNVSNLAAKPLAKPGSQAATTKVAKAADRVKVQTAAELDDAVNELKEELAAEGQRLLEIKKPSSGSMISALKIKLGASLVKASSRSNIKIAELVKTWGVDAKGRVTGEITMMDFRKARLQKSTPTGHCYA